MNYCILSATIAMLSCYSAVGPARAQQPTVRFLRLVILDTSGSMAGERIQAVREELLDNARQLPPSPEFPIIIVPFHSVVDQVYHFKDLHTLEAYLKKLNPDGGTSIASGISRGVRELDAHKDVRHVCVLLYSDGEDSNETAIETEERRLDRLFAARQQSGLKQCVVFAKRWESANSRLVAMMKRQGHARVIDSGELRFLPLTLTPRFNVSQCQWSADNPRLLKVNISARIDILGKSGTTTLAPLEVRCLNADAKGDIVTRLTPGSSTPRIQSILLPIDAKLAAKGGRVEVQFQITEPREVSSKEGLLLPILPVDLIRVPIDLPRLRFQSLISIKASQVAPTRWIDPLTRAAEVPVLLTIEITSNPSCPWEQPAKFRITLASGNRLLSDSDTFTLKGPGSHTVRLRIAANQRGTNGPLPVELTIAPLNPDPYQKFEPPHLTFRQEFAAPLPVTTTIRARVLAATAPQWAQISTGIADLTAKIEVRVEGPLPANLDVVLRCPPAVRYIRVEPTKLHSGTQIITLNLKVTLQPAPTKTTLNFQVDPPRHEGALTISAAQPLQLTVVGPPAPQIVLAVGDSIPSVLEITMSDNARTATLRATPVIAGVRNPLAARDSQAVVRCMPPLQLNGTPSSVELSHPAEFHVKTVEDVQRSFFQDTHVEGSISTTPAASDAVAYGSKQHLVLCIEAPFKRLLFYLTAALSILVALYLCGRLILRLTRVE